MIKRKLLFLLIPLALALGFYFLLVRLGAPPLKVVSAIPREGETFVNTATEIVLELNRPLSQKEILLFSASIAPEEKLQIGFAEKEIKISPAGEFAPDTKYTLTVMFRGEVLYTLTFTTFPFTQNQLTEEGKVQSEADFAFGERYKEFLAQYPWYLYLPVERDDYRIVYDFEKASFRIRFKRGPTDTVDAKKFTDAALNDLKKVGVPEPIKYYTLGPND